MQIHVTITLDIDPEAWALDYGLPNSDPATVEADARTYYNTEDVQSSLNDKQVFGPNATVVSAEISAIKP